MKILFRYLFLGTFSIIPLLVVVQVVIWVQNFSVDIFKQIKEYTNGDIESAVVIVVSLMFLTVVGYSTEKFGKSMFISTIERVLDRIPAIRTIYSVSKKITDIFTKDSDEKKEVVLVEYPKSGVWVIAYILNKYNDLRVLFVPTSPNPTSGYTVIVDKSLIIKTTLNIEEASKFIISMGSDFVKKEEIEKKIIENLKRD